MNSISRGIRNTFRNSIRTFSIVIILALSIGLALAMSTARSAVDAKISSVQSSIGNTVTISPAGVRGFEGGGEPLTEESISKVKGLDHVESVSGTLSDRLTSDSTDLESSIEAGSLGMRNSNNSGQSIMSAPPMGMQSADGTSTTRSFTPPVTALGTNAPEDISSTQGGGAFSLKSGEAFSSGSTELVALVGESLATKNNLTVGSTFTAYDKTITIVGIFDAGNTFSNNQVIMPLATLQTISSQEGQVSSATITVDSIENVESVTTAAKSALGETADVTNSKETAEASIEPLENIRKISFMSLIGSVIAGGIIILLTMVMIVRERRREIGVLKSIGASTTSVTVQFMAEALTFTVLGAFVGLGIGVIAGQPLTNMLVTNSSSSTAQTQPGQMSAGRMNGGPGIRRVRNNLTNIQTSVGVELLAYGLSAAFVIALFGAGVSALLTSKIRPAEVMRTE